MPNRVDRSSPDAGSMSLGSTSQETTGISIAGNSREGNLPATSVDGLTQSASRFQTARNPLPAWKRTLDILCILAVAPVLLPVMAATALMVRLTSRGPVLFRQERIGLYGQKFMCLKIRTMHVAAETKSHQAHLAALMTSDKPMTKLDLEDERIIPLGMFLRATGLDELPQLLNVLRGEMSLVGPRPCLPYEHDKFMAADPRRFDSVPGLTGLWQVSGKNKTTFQQMVSLDVEYSQSLSLWLDLRILASTLPVLIGQTGVVARNKWRRLTKSRATKNNTV